MSVLSVFTLVVAILYTKRIHEAHQRYVKAKNAVDDIIVSFNKQLQRQGERLENSAHRISAFSNQRDLLARKLKDLSKDFQLLREEVQSFRPLKKALTKTNALEERFSEIVTMRDNLLQRVSRIEKQHARRGEAGPKIESAIPIKREEALAPLNETELAVLESLASEGEKTAPEIKEQIKLSREHTARLMKKLYERGYLERTTSRIPFTYRLKGEMRKLLKKPEQKS